MAESANVAKYNLGGSGDNYVADGYIKSVEKVWLDSYTIAFTNTNTTIDLAILPNNKKVTGITVIIDTTAAQSSGTVSIGYSTDASINTFLNPSTITHNATRTSISLPVGFLSNGTVVVDFHGRAAGFQAVTAGTQTTISLKLNNWTMTTGTVKSIVRYT